MTFYHGQGYWHRVGGNGGGGPSSGEISFKSVSVITIGGGGGGVIMGGGDWRGAGVGVKISRDVSN